MEILNRFYFFYAFAEIKTFSHCCVVDEDQRNGHFHTINFFRKFGAPLFSFY